MSYLVPMGEVASASGLTTDRIRLWERRHGWPMPAARDASGERLYTIEQLYEIRRVARLVRLGGRIGRLVPVRG
jgi:DNA-binding transcriptional MerR regulator